MSSFTKSNGSFIRRWLSRNSEFTADQTVGSGNSDLASECFSPPPLTDSSSTTGVSSAILTPRSSTTHSTLPAKAVRFSAVKRPYAPQPLHNDIPSVSSRRKPALSLPASSKRPSTLTAHPRSQHTTLHEILTYDPVRHALKFNITLPICFILQYPQPGSDSPMFVHGHSGSVSHLSALAQPRPISDRDLSQYATTPPVTHMKITSDIVPWSIHIHGRTSHPNDPRSFIRIVDVLDGIYNSLRMGISNTEWAMVKKPFREKVKTAYSARCVASRSFTLKGYEERQGVRRIDYFLDKTMFVGLRDVPDDENGRQRLDPGAGVERTWLLMVERCPRD